MRKRLLFEHLESRELLAADLIITEFMASNGGVIEDGNGASSDWIEIYNNGDQSADLLGYSLTDDYDDLNKWSFPTSEVLAPGEYLIVFASGNDEVDSAGYFHTNFALSASGEYLGLVDPIGNVLTEYGSSTSDYPQQISNISYGLAFDAPLNAPVTPESSVSYLIPTDSSVDSVWMDSDFDDSSWQSGTASLGYEWSGTNFANAGLLDTQLPTGTTTTYVRIPFSISDTSTLLSKLQMKYDDGFVAYINGALVASANAPSTPGYSSRATTDHPDSEAVVYVDFDVSGYSDLLVEGENILAIHMLNRYSNSSDYLASIQLLTVTGGPIEPYVIGALQTPTPGTPNTNLLASEVEFSQAGGLFIDTFQLVLETSDASEVIRYTTDGSAPTASSTLYTGPITVSDTIQIRARAFGPLGQVGGIHSETYTHTDSTTAAFTSDLPIIVLENFGEGTPGTGDFEDAAMSLYDVDPVTGRASLSNAADISTLIGQHRRGRSTANNPKTNLRIEIRDEYGEDKSIELLGMPSESDWILYAPYTFDRAMLRNTTFFQLSEAMGNWAPRIRFVEVYANFSPFNNNLTSADYMGVYVLMENIKRDSNRVDIDELTSTQNSEPEITGGYIIAMDGIDGETPDGAAWKTDRSIPTLGDSWLVLEEPDAYELTDAQVDYIRGYVQDFEDALYGPDSTDPELGYAAYLDVEQTIDHHILRVLSKEPDSLRLSTFLTKERDGKLAFGPVWDFDRSSGADNDSRSANPEGWYLPDVDFFGSDWWGPLFDDPNFAQQWVDRWQELRAGVLSDDSLRALMNSQADQIAEAQVRNFERWPEVAPNGGTYADAGLTGWEAEVSHLTNWLIIRANWIDDQLIQMPFLTPSPGNTELGQEVELTALAGSTIYYTLDGTDPRANGGGISPSAIEYTGPITITSTTEINARAYGVAAGSSSSNSSYPSSESPPNVLDGNPLTKYLNFGGANSGIILTPDYGSSIVKSFVLTTANDADQRDPASWVLYGTNETIQSSDNSAGVSENWTLIDSGDISLPDDRYTDSSPIEVNNSTAYTSYKLIFPTLKNSSGYMQVADIYFYDSPNGLGTQLLSTRDTALAIHEVSFEGISSWSSLVSGLYSVEVPADASSLRISEVHYHPADPTTAELVLAPGTDNGDYEFIELVNTSQQTISLNGVMISGGITFDFTTGNVTALTPGQSVVVVKNAEAFAVRYGADITIAGEFDGSLSNGGEQLILTDGSGLSIHSFTYEDAAPWPTSPDGDGPSLEVVDLFGDYSSPTNWRASSTDGGSPGVHRLLQGDYDYNGLVDMNDYQVWKSNYGSTTSLAADGNQDGQVSLADYTLWRDNLGAVFTAPASIAAIASTKSTQEPEATPTVAETSSTPTSEATAESATPSVATQSTGDTSTEPVIAAVAGESSDSSVVVTLKKIITPKLSEPTANHVHLAAPAYPIQASNRLRGSFSPASSAVIAPLSDNSVTSGTSSESQLLLDLAFSDLDRLEQRVTSTPVEGQPTSEDSTLEIAALDEALFEEL